MTNNNGLYEEEIRKSKYEMLYEKFVKLENRGIRILIQGNYFPLKKCAEIMSVNENACYMPDIMEDSTGRIVEINYDYVAQI